MSLLDTSDVRYGIYFPDDDKVLELLSDGVITLTCDSFRAKTMQTVYHAEQLARALKLTNYKVVTVLCKIEL